MSRQRQSPLYIRVLVLKQGDQWLAQGLDHDLAAQGPSDRQAIQSFLRILRARMKRDHERGKLPLEGLPPAPDRFFDVWERAQRDLHDGLVTETTSDPTDDVPPAYVIKQIVQGAGGADLNH